MIEELEARYAFSLPPWFARFSDAPDAAVADLLDDRIAVALGEYEDPISFVVSIFNEVGGQALSELDAALERWIAAYPLTGQMSVAAWARAGQVVYAMAEAPRSWRRLRDRLDDLATRLPVWDVATGVGGYAWILLALTAHQVDALLAPLWRRLAVLEGGLPEAYGEIGLRGLLEMPTEEGGFRPDLAIALLEMGKSLLRRGLPRDQAERLFKQAALLLMDAVPFPDEWNKYQLHPLALEADDNGLLATWLREMPKRLGGGPRFTSPTFVTPTTPTESVVEVVELVSSGDIDGAVGALDRLRQASAMGGTSVFVHVLCAASKEARYSGYPDKSLLWAEEAFGLAPFNPYVWTHLGEALTANSEPNRAVLVSFLAASRFPYNSFIWSELARNTGLAQLVPEHDDVFDVFAERFPGAPTPREVPAGSSQDPASVVAAATRPHEIDGVIAWVRFLLLVADREGVDYQERLARAQLVLDNLLDAYPEIPEALVQKADLLLFEGRIGEAEVIAGRLTDGVAAPAALGVLGAVRRTRVDAIWDEQAAPWLQLRSTPGFDAVAGLGLVNSSLVANVADPERLQRSCMSELREAVLRTRQTDIAQGLPAEDSFYEEKRDLLDLGWSNSVLNVIAPLDLELNSTSPVGESDVDIDFAIERASESKQDLVRLERLFMFGRSLAR